MSAFRLSSRFIRGQWDGLAIAAFVLLVVSILFGGASRLHELRLALVELAALPLLVLGIQRLVQSGAWREHRFAIGIAAGLVAIPAVQLIPLPPAIWTGLPGRSELTLALELAEVQPGWLPLSLTPELTWRSILALVPPLAMFLALLVPTEGLPGRLVRLYAIAAAISIFLGGAQLISGGERLYPWATTDAGSVNGFFANRNHLATLVLATLPFAAVVGASSLRRRNPDSSSIWFAAFFVALAVVGLAAIRSRFGVILVFPVMIASFVAVWIAAGRGRPNPALLSMLGAAGVALTAVAIFALPPLLARFDPGYEAGGRFDRWPTVLEAADTYLPLGSGIGSFDVVYRSVEPLTELDATFFNQAHNDYVESWLETGWLGAGLLIAFLIWYGRRLWTVWRAAPSRVTDLQRAASIAIAVVLVHSGADYPLRTTAIAVLFALCCALLDSGASGRATEVGRTRGEG